MADGRDFGHGRRHESSAAQSSRDDWEDKFGSRMENDSLKPSTNFQGFRDNRMGRREERSPEKSSGEYRDSKRLRDDRRGYRERERSFSPRRSHRRDDHDRGERETSYRRPHNEDYSRSRSGGGRNHNSHDGGEIRELSDAIPELYSVIRGTVKSVRPFGLFVGLEGFRKQALVHLSQVTEFELTKKEDSDESKVESLSAVAGVGEKVWVKIVSVKDEESGNPKIGASMKLVDQREGKDKDPTNLRVQETNKPPWEPPKKFEIEAVLNVTCTRCGGEGHLKTECYADMDKKYDLLPPEEEEVRGMVERRGQDSGGVVGEGSGRVIGRGRGAAMTQPAWMTRGASGLGVSIGGENAGFSSREEALAMVETLERERKERKARRKERKKKKEKREKRERRERRKKRKDQKSETESSSGSGSSSTESETESEDERRERRRRRKERRKQKRGSKKS